MARPKHPENFHIILYKNGKRHQHIKSYVNYFNALRGFKRILSKNKVYLAKEYDWLNQRTEFELVLIGTSGGKNLTSIKNDLGLAVKIEACGDFNIKKIAPWYVEEVFTNRFTGKRYTFLQAMKYLMKKPHLTHILIAYNNKIVIEHFEDEKMDLFVAKNKETAKKFVATAKKFNTANNLGNYIYFEDPTVETKRRVNKALQEKYNIPMEYMKKITTR